MTRRGSVWAARGGCVRVWWAVIVLSLVAARCGADDEAPRSPEPRGELVVSATEAAGVIAEIPDGPVLGGPPAMPAQYRVTDPDEVRVETIAEHLEVPWALAFAPDGRLFVTERPGRVRIVDGGVLRPDPWLTLAVNAVGEGGLMGLTLHPDFRDEPWIYVCYTVAVGGASLNRISRVREVDGRGGSEEILIDEIPGEIVHDGCRLKFGPDGKLYATTGDALAPSRAQDPTSLAGKILRLNPDGSVPADNPLGPDSPVYSRGHRNPQGLAWDPVTGRLFSTEHGPSGEFGLRANDEVNVIVRGENYGWPRAVGAPGRSGLRDPLLLYPDVAVPPAGATFYTGDRITAWKGDFLFTSLRGEHLQRVVLDGRDRTRVSAIERLFETGRHAGRFGRLRDVITGADGFVYLATSNRDGRGSPRPTDDRILRLLPADGVSVAMDAQDR